MQSTCSMAQAHLLASEQHMGSAWQSQQSSKYKRTRAKQQHPATTKTNKLSNAQAKSSSSFFLPSNSPIPFLHRASNERQSMEHVQNMNRALDQPSASLLPSTCVFRCTRLVSCSQATCALRIAPSPPPSHAPVLARPPPPAPAPAQPPRPQLRAAHSRALRAHLPLCTIEVVLGQPGWLLPWGGAGRAWAQVPH